MTGVHTWALPLCVVAAFPLLVVSNCLWGLGWALSSGADVAWITDELDQPDAIDRILAAQARRGLLGTATGIVAFGALAWAAARRGGPRGGAAGKGGA